MITAKNATMAAMMMPTMPSKMVTTTKGRA
jgi:hypothetical protein